MEELRKVFPESATVTLDEVYADLQFEPRQGRPYVAINMVSTVDGRSTFGGAMQQARIGSPVDRQLMGWVRHAVDLIVRGASTLRANPVYPEVPRELERVRLNKGMSRQPVAAVITNSCDLPFQAEFFSQEHGKPIVLTSQQAPQQQVAKAQETSHVEIAGEHRVDPLHALHVLQNEYNIDRVLLEGGPKLNYHFLRQGVVDELFWTVAPKMIGGQDELSIVEADDLFDPILQLKLLSAYILHDELFLRYKVL